MTTHGSLPPHLEQFIREQLATGHFRSEADVIRASLDLLESQAYADDATAEWLKQEIEKGACSRPAAPATPEFWDRLRERARGGSGVGRGD